MKGEEVASLQGAFEKIMWKSSTVEAPHILETYTKRVKMMLPGNGKTFLPDNEGPHTKCPV